MPEDQDLQDELDQERATGEGMPENPATARLGVLLIIPSERRNDASTPGMTREAAISTHGMWSGVARTPAGSASGWHHHGTYESSIYVLSGTLRMEFGPDGTEGIEAGPGDFVYIAQGVVHREINPGAFESEIVVSRSGAGDPVVNVDGPG
jgi:uncharacterized RmlC-like cupin family protein